MRASSKWDDDLAGHLRHAGRSGRTRTASDGVFQRKPLPSLAQRAALHHVDKGQVLRDVKSCDLTDTDGPKAHMQAVGELQHLEVLGMATVFRLCAVRPVTNASVEILENSVDFRLQLRESESPLTSRSNSGGEGGLPRPSVVNVSQLRTVDRRQLAERVGALGHDRIQEVLQGRLYCWEPTG